MSPAGFSVPQSTKATQTPIVVVISDDDEWTSDEEIVASHYDNTNIVHPTKNSTPLIIFCVGC